MTNIQKMDAAQSGVNAASAVSYGTFPNAMPASQEAAPCLGRAYVNETAGQKEVFDSMKSYGYQMGEAEAERIWNAIGFAVKNRMPQECRAYNLGFVRLLPAISGTFDSADADFDPERNRLYVAAVPSAEIRDAILDGTPTRIGGMSPNGARIDNVSYGDGKSANTIKSGEALAINGSGLTIGVGGERAELVLPDGTLVPVGLNVPSGDAGIAQRLVGQLAQTVPACEGAVLRIWTHGFNPAAALVLVTSCRLTVLADEPPVPTNPPHIERGWSVGHEDEFDFCYADGSGFVLQGQNLDGAAVTVSSSNDQGETWVNVQTVPADKLTTDGDKVTIDGNWLDVWYNNLNANDYVKFTVANASGEDSTQRQLAA